MEYEYDSNSDIGQVQQFLAPEDQRNEIKAKSGVSCLRMFRSSVWLLFLGESGARCFVGEFVWDAVMIFKA